MYRFILLLFLYPALSFSQDQKVIDDLKQKLEQNIHDTVKLKVLSDLSWELKSLGKTKAFDYAKQELDLATALNEPKCISQGYNDLGIIYYQRGEMDKALEAYEQSLAIREKLKDKTLIASSLNKIAIIYHELGNYSKALQKQLRVLKIYLEENNVKYIVYTYLNIGELYNQLNDYEKALEYWNKALVANEKLGDKYSLGIINTNKAIIFEKQKKYDFAIESLVKGAALFLEIKDFDAYSACLNNLGQTYVNTGDTKKGLEAFQKALDVSIKYEDSHGEAKFLCNLGIVQTDLNNYKVAETYLLKSLGIAQKNHIVSVERATFKALATLYIKKKDNKAMEYYLKYDQLKDTIFSKESAKQIAEMQTKYETEKKEKENIELKRKTEVQQLQIANEDQKQKNQLIIILAIAITLVGISLFIYNKRKQLQKLEHAGELAEAEKLRFKDVIEAEEKERSRIAQDLHDGLGQLLSTARLNVASLEDSVIAEDKPDLDRSLKIIDDACIEVRNISHNMMPSALIRLGLTPAINELVNNVNATKSVKIDFTTNVSESLGKSLDITIYRVIQEVLNNMIKHSKADHINMLINKNANELKINIKDNGVGFDVEKIKESKGLGWKNIFSRVSMLNGTIKVESLLQKGTMVYVELKLKST